jgi:hypothetical protein
MPALQKPRPAAAILVGGLTAGILDLTAACVTWGIRAGIKPIRIMQSIASGWQGTAAFQGGWHSAALGVALHFLIALTAAAIFYALSRKITFLIRQAVLSGFVYGIAVYFFMTYVVVAHSAFPRKGGSFNLTNFIIAIITHMFCVGLPIALSVRNFSKNLFEK